MSDNFETEFNWQTDKHVTAAESLSRLADSMAEVEVPEHILMEVLFVISFTHHLHSAERASLTSFIEEGLEAIPDPGTEDMVVH